MLITGRSAIGIRNKNARRNRAREAMKTKDNIGTYPDNMRTRLRGLGVYGQGILFVLLVVGIGLLRYTVDSVLRLPYVSLLTVIYIVFYVQWMYRTWLRFPQKYARRFITVFTVLLVFFNLVRLIKWDYSVDGGAVERYMWYLFYVPITLLPALNIHTLLHIDLSDNAARSHWWYLMYFPALGMIAGVLTNDLHQLAFRFPPDMQDWENLYTHGPLFHIITAWVVIGIVVVLVITVKMCINRRLYKNLWIPVAVVLVGLLYRLTYTFHGEHGKFFLQEMYEISDLMGLVWIVFWESLISTRLLPSNRGYAEVFAESSLRAGLADASFTPVQLSSEGLSPAPAQLRAAANGEYLPEDGDTVLKARPVRGGWFYWTEDIGALRELRAALQDTAEELAEENAFLQQKAQIDEDHRRTLHQTELYNSIALQIRPQLQKLERMLENVPEDEAEFCLLLKRTAVLYAYLKRYPNLLLLADAGRPVDRAEMLRCLEESANALRQLGVACVIRAEKVLPLSGETAARIYALFEEALELGLDSLSAVHTELCRTDGSTLFCINMEWNRPVAPQLQDSLRTQAQRIGSAACSFGDDTLRIEVPVSGEAVQV